MLNPRIAWPKKKNPRIADTEKNLGNEILLVTRLVTRYMLVISSLSHFAFKNKNPQTRGHK